jgi:subtilisin family serine protease
MSWQRLFVVFLAAAVVASLASAPPSQEKASYIVVLKDGRQLDAHRISVAQERVLSRAGGEGLVVKHRYSNLNAFSAEATPEEVERLRNDPGVAGVYLDRRVRISLGDSVPLINASEVWSLSVGGVNLTGVTESVCVIDTGVDYTHPDLGGCSLVENTYSGGVFAYSLESSHPYADSSSVLWKINYSGFSSISAHFSSLSTEAHYDYVKVYDGSMRIIAEYSGSHPDTWTPPAEGDTMYVSLVSDAFTTDFGFVIDEVINGSVNTTYNWGNCSKVVGGYDIYNSDQNPWDDNGHGTHCAGIVAADGGAVGVAPGARIIAIKALDSGGGGWDSDVMAGVDWCVNNSEVYNISVISMSLGDGVSHATYCDGLYPYVSAAINAAVAKNISVVVASGNEDYLTGIASPACVRNATPIGSTTKLDAVSGFTNRGSGFPELLLAPGQSITSTYPGGGYLPMSGTSMATPHAAGAVALIRSYLRLTGGGKTPAEIESLLNRTGKRIFDAGTGMYFSRIDVYAAVAEVSTPIVSQNSPANASYVNTNFSLLNWTCVDPWGGNLTAFVYGDNSSAATLQASLNCSSGVSCSFNWTGLNESAYGWKVGCGNMMGFSNSTARSFVVDTTPPAASFVSPTPGNGSETDFNLVSFNISHTEDNPSTLVFYVNGSPQYQSYSGASTLIQRTLTNGVYNYSVWVNDSAGNFKQTESRYLLVNATPPAVALVSPASGSLSAGAVNLSCNASDNVFVESISLYWNLSGIWAENESAAASSAGFYKSSLPEGYFSWSCYPATTPATAHSARTAPSSSTQRHR